MQFLALHWHRFLTEIEIRKKYVCILADSGFYYQGGVKSTISGVFEDLKIKVSEDYKQN